MLLMSIDWMLSICAHWGSWFGYFGLTEHQTQLWYQDVDHQLCSWCFVNAVCGHVRRMKDGRNHKDILHGDIISGKCNLGRPQLRYWDASWTWRKWIPEEIGRTTDRSKWRSYFQTTLNVIAALESKRRLKKEKLKAANLIVSNTVTNGLDPLSFAIEGDLLLIWSTKMFQYILI